MTDSTVLGWFAGRIPDGWFTQAVDVQTDRDEIIVTGTLSQPQVGEAGEVAAREAEASRIEAFREESRSKRMEIARAAEHHFERKVSWAVTCGETNELWTHLAAPAMTRLRMPERRVLDTLIDAGIARSRSEALAWCVKLVGRHESEWLAELQDAMEAVQQVRGRGPNADRQ